MRLEKSFLILMTMLKCIRNTFYSKIKKNCMLICLLVSFFTISGIIMSYKAFFPIISAIVSGNRSLFFSFISSSMLNVTLITFVIYIVMINSNNESSNYSKIIKWLPLTKKEKTFAQIFQELFFIVSTNLCYIIFFHIPSFIVAKVNIKIMIIYLLSIFAQSILIYILLNIIYLSIIRLLYFISHKKFIKELTLIILGVNSFVYLVSKINLENILVKSGEYKLSIINILIPIIDSFMGYEYFNSENLKICLALTSVILILGIIITIYFGGVELENRNLMLFKYIPKFKSKFLWIIIKEIKQIVRSEVNISNLFVLLFITGSIRFIDANYINNSLANILLVSFCSIFTLNSFGEDMNFNIFSNVVPISSNMISYGKLIGNIIVGTLLYTTLYFIVFTYLGIDVEIFKNGLLYTIEGTIVIFAYGIIVPIKEKEPFSNIIVFLSFITICTLISIIATTFNGVYIYESIILLTIATIFSIPKLYKIKSRIH